jgi:hypothetical protein
MDIGMDNGAGRNVKRDDSWYAARLQDMGVPRETVAKFLEYKNRNLSVWLDFEAETLKAIEQNEHVTAKGIAERVRELWKNQGTSNGKQHAICNTWISYFARVFMLKHADKAPHYKYFKTNPVKGVR